ncbi:MAG: integrase/recombinase XerD [Chloroflexota bacterium]|jgi:integrase/recombinase XerD|nr:integrase/recombinase XerD [Chloroflexota bacterium]
MRSTADSGLSECIDAFLDHMANQRRVAPNTIAAYHNDLRQFVEHLVAEADDLTRLASLDSAALTGYVLCLRDKGYAQATVARKIAAVKSFFHYAVESGLVRENPAAALDSPRVRRAQPRPASAADVQALLDAGCSGAGPDSLRNRAMLTLLYHSGMRVSEVVALDVHDLDLSAGTVLCRGRGDRARSIPLPVEARDALDLYLDEGRPLLGRDLSEEEHALFLNHRGTRLTRQGFWLIMKDRAREAGIEASITPHTLRHSFAYQHLDSGTALRELKELLGHMNISTTQIYTTPDHVTPASA